VVSSLILIYHQHLAAPDGTSVQLARLLLGSGRRVLHIHGQTPRQRSLTLNDYAALCVPSELPFRPPAGYYRLRKLWHRRITPGLARWRWHRFPAAQDLSASTALAYVVVYDESQATYASAALRAAHVTRYVVHLMDWLEPKTSAIETPQLARLLHGAAHTFVVSTRLAKVVAPLCTGTPEVLPLASGLPDQLPSLERRPVLLMAGGMYTHDKRRNAFLHDCALKAWQRFCAGRASARWYYVGADSADLAPLRPHVRPLGHLTDRDYHAELLSARAALLPIVHAPHRPFQYSIPSRLVDYLAAGLPTLASSIPGTATDDFLQAHAESGMMHVESEEEILKALERLFDDDDYHWRLSQAAQAAGRQHSLARIRLRIDEVLEGARDAPRAATVG